MEIYPQSAYQNARGARPNAGPSRGATKDPYANYLAVVPAGQAAALPRPVSGPQQSNSAARQVASQEAASRLMEAKMAALKGGTKVGTEPGPAPADQAQNPRGPAPAAQAQTSASTPRGFALHPEDSWLARLGFCADNWMDCDPATRVRYLQQAGCPTNQLNVVKSALDAWCSRRTGR